MAFEQESILSCLNCFGTNIRSLQSNQKEIKVSIYVSLAKHYIYILMLNYAVVRNISEFTC